MIIYDMVIAEGGNNASENQSDNRLPSTRW